MTDTTLIKRFLKKQTVNVKTAEAGKIYGVKPVVSKLEVLGEGIARKVIIYRDLYRRLNLE